MASSPIVEVQDGAGPWVPTTNGVDVTPGNTISVRLQTPGGVSSWTLQIFGVDEVTAIAPALIGVNPITHLVATPATVVTFTMPAGVGIARALVFRSAVDGGGSGFTKQFGIYVLTLAGARVGAVGEKFEGDPTFGWARKLNPLIRNPASGSPVGVAGGDLGGSYPFPDVVKIHGTTVPTAGVPEIGKVLTITAAGVASWSPTGVSFTAGGDLTGTSTNQTVNRINGMPVAPSTEGHAQDFLRMEPNPFRLPTSEVWDGTHLWVGNTGSDDLLRIDTSTTPPTLVKTLRVPQAINLSTGAPLGIVVLAVDSTHVYVAGDSSSGGLSAPLFLINKSTYAISGLISPAEVAFSPAQTSFVYRVAVNGDDIFVMSGLPDNRQLHKFSKTAVLAAYPLEGTSVGSLTGLGPVNGFIHNAGSIYITSRSWIQKISSALAIVDSFSAPTDLGRVTYAFGSVWAHYFDTWARVARFNPSSLSTGPTALVMMPNATFDGGAELASDSSTLWALNRTSLPIGGYLGELVRISTGVGTEAVVTSFVDPVYENLGPIVFDGTKLWLLSSSRSGLLNCSTGLSPALGVLWEGTPTLKYTNVFEKGDLGYNTYPINDDTLQVLSLRHMPISSAATDALPNQVLLTTVNQVVGLTQNIAFDPATGAIWATGSDNLIQLPFPQTSGHPNAVVINVRHPVTLDLLPAGCIAIDETHVLFTDNRPYPDENHYLVILDKATNQVVGLGEIGPGVGTFPIADQGQSTLVVNGDDIFAVTFGISNAYTVHKFSKTACLGSFPAASTAVATLTLPDLDVIQDLCFTGGYLFTSGISHALLTNNYSQLTKIDPTGPMSIADTWTATYAGTWNKCHVAFGSVWFTTGSWRRVLRFDPTAIGAGPIAIVDLTGALGTPSPITDDGTFILVGDREATGKIARIFPTLGSEHLDGTTNLPRWNALDPLTIPAISSLTKGSEGTLWAGDITNGALIRITSGLNGLQFFFWQGPLQFVYSPPLGVTNPDPLGKADGDFIEVLNTPTGIAMPDYTTPRAMVSDGVYLYVAENSTNVSGTPKIWKLAVTDAGITAVAELDLSAEYASVLTVRDLAQDTNYLYAATWNGAHVAIIDKATMTVVGWGYAGNKQRVVSVCADGAGHFFCYTQPNGGAFTGIQKFITFNCIGQPPKTITAAGSLATSLGRFIRYGGGEIWFTDGNSGSGIALRKIDPVFLTETATVTAIVADSTTMLAIYAFGSVWVSSLSGNIHRVDPSTVVGVVPTLTPLATLSLGGTAGEGLEIGPNSAGTPNSWLWVACNSGGLVGSIDPITNLTGLAFVAPVAANREYEGIAVLGNFVYFAAFDAGAGPGTTGIDYYNPVTTSTGTIATLALVDDWHLRYREIMGDLRGPLRNNFLSNIRGVVTPAGSTSFNGAILRVQPAFVQPLWTAWDPIGGQVWVTDGQQKILFAFDPGSQTLREYPIVFPVIPVGVTGLNRVVVDTNYIYATAQRTFGSASTIYVFNRSTGALVGSGGCTGFAAATGLVLDGSGNLYVSSTYGVDKFTVASLIGSFDVPSPGGLSLSGGGTDIAWDGGNYLFVTSTGSSNVYRVDATFLTLAGTYFETLVEPTFRGILYAFGSLWFGIENYSVGVVVRLDPTTMSGPTYVTPLSTVFPAGGGSGWLASDGTHVWVANGNNYGLYRINPATNSTAVMAGVTDTTDQHGGLAFNGTDTMWSAVTFSTPGAGITAYATSPAYPNETVRFTAAANKLVYVTLPGPSGAASGDLSGTYPSPTVAKINGTTVNTTSISDVGKYLNITAAGVSAWSDITKIQAVVISATPPSAGQVLTATTATAANWQTPSGGSTVYGDNASAARATTERGMTQGISHQLLNFTATEIFADHVHTGSGVLIGLKDLRYVRLYDSVSGYAISTSTTSGTVYSVDLTTADFRQLCYVGYEQKRHNSPRQFVFAAGASGFRRIEMGQSTGGAGAIVSTNSGFAIRAMVYDGYFLYLWDYTNGKIQKVNNPNDLSASGMVLTDYTANGTVPVASFTGRSNFMTHDGTNIWCIEGNKLFKIVGANFPGAGTVTSYTFSTPGSGRAVLWDGKYLWVTSNGALKRVLPTDVDPANNGTQVLTGVAFNAGDVLGTDGDLVYAGLSSQGSGLFSIIVIDPDVVNVVQDIQGIANPFNMATMGVGANRRITVAGGLTTGGLGAIYTLNRHAPGQLKSLRTTGARFKSQTTILYGSGNYYVTPNDHIIAVSDNGGASSGAVTINLPAISPVVTGGNGGREIVIIDMAGALGGGNTITIAAAAGETINGAASVTMTGAYAVNTVWYCVNIFGLNPGTGWVRKA